MTSTSGEMQLDQARQQELLAAVPGIIEDLLRQGILRSQWGEVLYAGPMAIQIMGSTFIAASSDMAATVKLKVNKRDRYGNEVRVLPWETLNANLTHCGNLGRKSFMEAQSRMDSLTRLSGYLAKQGGTISQIIEMIDTPEVARFSLRRQMKKLQDSADKCKVEAEIIESNSTNGFSLLSTSKRRPSIENVSCTALIRLVHMLTALAEISVEEKKLNEVAQIARQGQQNEKINQEEHYRDSLKTLQTALAIATDDYQKAIAQCETISKQNSAPLPAPNFNDLVPVAEVPRPSKGGGFIAYGFSRVFGKSRSQREEEARYARDLLEAERLNQQRAAEIMQQELKERKRAAAAALEQVERARENVRNAQLGLGTSHTQYQKGAQDLQTATAALAEVQAELKSLKYENLTLENIHSILAKSIEALSQLKSQVGALTSFYKEVSGMIAFAVAQPLDDFLGTIEDGIAAGDHELNSESKVERMKLHESQKRNLMACALSIQCYFSVISEISSTYVQVSKKHIMPGVNFIDELALTKATTGHEYHEKAHRLETWAADSKHEIEDVANARQDSIMNDLEHLVQTLAKRARILPPPPKPNPAERCGESNVDAGVIKGLELLIILSPKSIRKLVVRVFRGAVETRYLRIPVKIGRIHRAAQCGTAGVFPGLVEDGDVSNGMRYALKQAGYCLRLPLPVIRVQQDAMYSY
ncbi:hypothetical protein BDD12DRAFT_874098 [Trichophaea hybrida]|nr:hypothetical protein BDD12DRAFT_874098 [Trichophaea hybrida]